MIPEPIQDNVRDKSVGPEDAVTVLNREVIPVLRKVRNALNELLAHLGSPPAVVGSRAVPEQALASALAVLDALSLIDDQSTV